MALMAVRDAYGETLAGIGADERIVVLDADLQCCTRTDRFSELYPERYLNVGIAEANMIGLAAGMAACGKIVFANSFAMFTSGRAYEQIRNSVAYPHLNVKIIGDHAGLTIGKDGASHQCIEDIALMRAVPGMMVLSPCDANEARLMTRAIASYDGPCYMRFSLPEVEEFTDKIPDYSFDLCRASTLFEGDDVAIIATGLMVSESLKARDMLKEEGISAGIIDMHTIKPIDEEAVTLAAKKAGCLVTAEDANIIGGLGSAVAEVTAQNCPVPVERIGIRDIFGRSGETGKLMERYGLTASDIVKAAELAISKKA